MEELDHILMLQLHSARKTNKMIKRLKKIMKLKELDEVEEANLLRQQFFESMVNNKSLLKKNKIKKIEKNKDVLDKNVFYYLYRNTIMASAFGYMYFSAAIQKYWNYYFSRDDNEKNNKES